ncbi:asparaginase [Brachybacterium huguangmaarense]
MTDDAAPRVLALSLGGTIAMSQDASGLRATPPEMPGADEVRTEIAGAEVTHVAIASVGSPSVRVEHLAEVLERAREAVAAGARGVVVTHGTDTLEESAFLLERFWDLPAPLVLTGAMRPANAPGADGPANLRDAVRTAIAPSARGLGVLVVFDGLVHLADRVAKVSSRSVDAFASEPSGPVALVGERDVRLVYRPTERLGIVDGAMPSALPRVPVIALGLGDDGEVLDLLDGPEGPGGSGGGAIAGLVIAGVGMGHVPALAVARLRHLVEAGVSVVIATRVASGGTAVDHYDYPGSEVDLIRTGCVMAGRLSPHSARLLLQVLLADGADTGRIGREFAAYGY